MKLTGLLTSAIASLKAELILNEAAFALEVAVEKDCGGEPYELEEPALLASAFKLLPHD
jgi:hypothetical protein